MDFIALMLMMLGFPAQAWEVEPPISAILVGTDPFLTPSTMSEPRGNVPRELRVSANATAPAMAKPTSEQPAEAIAKSRQASQPTEIEPVSRATHRQSIGDSAVEPLADWRNLPGLADLADHLLNNEFSTILSSRVELLDHGQIEFSYQLNEQRTDSTLVVAVLSEDPIDNLNLQITGDSSGRPYSGRDGSSHSDAAVKIRASSFGDPRDLTLKISEPTRTSTARVLILEVGGDNEGNTSLLSWVTESGCQKVPSDRSKGAGSQPSYSHDATIKRLSGRTPVVKIPLHGVVGANYENFDFFTAADFTAAIEAARRLNPSHIVLEIDSPGGRIDTKDEIIRVILSSVARGDAISAVLKDAGSSAALISLACTEIMAYPGARFGAAVYLKNLESGAVSLKKLFDDDPELAAKYRSFNDAMDNEAALATRRSPAIGMAMKHAANELWWSPSTGFSDAKISPDGECLDDSEEILTLTTTSIVRTGLGTQVLDETDLRRTLGVSSDTPIVNLAPMMRDSSRDLLGLIETWQAAFYLPLPEITNRIEELMNRP